jgi:hypothetical protein
MERITQIKACGCERGCQHMIISITEDIMIHKSELDDYLKEYNHPSRESRQ